MTLADLEAAVSNLPLSEKYSLYRYLGRQLQNAWGATAASRPHSVLDIPAVHLGPIMRPESLHDDLLGEMLEERM